MLKAPIKLGSTNKMIAYTSFSNIISTGAAMISGLLVARWLLPEQLGLFNSLSIFTSYIVLIQLGIPSGLNRELPLYFGKGDKIKAEEFAAVSKAWLTGLSVIVGVVCFFIAIYFLFRENYQYAIGSIVIGVTTWQNLYVVKYLKVLYRTNRDFNFLSRIRLINSIFLLASVFLVLYWKFYGLCVRALLLALVDFYFTYKWRPIKVKSLFKQSTFRQLTKIGLPMYAIANIYGLWPTLQRTWILATGGIKFLGLFALAIIIQNAMNSVSSALTSVMYPKMLRDWGNGATVKKIVNEIKKPLIFGIGLFIVIIPIGWIFLPTIVLKYLPNYTDGIMAAKYMLLVGVIELFIVIGNFYNVLNKQMNRLFAYLIGVGVWAIIILLYLYRFDFSLTIFPIAWLFGQMIILIINIHFIYRSRNLTIATV